MVLIVATHWDGQMPSLFPVLIASTSMKTARKTIPMRKALSTKAVINCVAQTAQKPTEAVLVRPGMWWATVGGVIVFNVTFLVGVDLSRV